NGYRGHDDRVAGDPLQRGHVDERRSLVLLVGAKQVQRPKRTAGCHDRGPGNESKLSPRPKQVPIFHGMTAVLLAPRSWCQQGVVVRSSMVRRGLIDDGLSRPSAQIGDQTLLAQRSARQADITAVQNEPMMGMAFVLRRHYAVELALDLEGRLAGCH